MVPERVCNEVRRLPYSLGNQSNVKGTINQ